MTPPALAQDTRTRLLESAILHFAAKGFDGTGIREIAKSANANSALVAYHFCGKEGLYLEALKAIFARKVSPVALLKDLPPAGSPGARKAALKGFQDYIRAFFTEIMSCGSDPVDEAAMILVGREMQAPRTASSALLMEHLKPYVVYLTNCLQILRPDLNEDELFTMGVSIQGLVIHFRNSIGIIRLIRGNPAYPEDLDRIIQHHIDFSLRGLGVPEAFPQPRTQPCS
ncbi:CerR family C-terminal domain-containing protein [Geothrix sp. PMB-07]|uniref:CerR family C-terminal domain-containing protein n=1 Tax=Geothrix sp. PMB-07 TaxID=3068640 RepID=UPI002741A16F|nr:CerR family C-terminal domain-containing protein [Geothrix sp. PMB-07]WLT32509.1 CerR family C-terminal domain-containing protein [Geothrix sp. PMB-07]